MGVSTYLLDGDPGGVRRPLECDLLVDVVDEVNALSGLVGGPISDYILSNDGFIVGLVASA